MILKAIHILLGETGRRSILMIPSITSHWSVGEFIVTELGLFCGVFGMEKNLST